MTDNDLADLLRRDIADLNQSIEMAVARGLTVQVRVDHQAVQQSHQGGVTGPVGPIFPVVIISLVRPLI